MNSSSKSPPQMHNFITLEVLRGLNSCLFLQVSLGPGTEPPRGVNCYTSGS